MNIKLLAILITTALTLFACGGGNSSSGVGKSSAVIEHDGVYVGSQSIKVFAPNGELLNTSEFAFNMSVFQNVVIISDTSFVAQATINAGAFSAASGQISNTLDEIRCNLILTYNGTATDGSVQGKIEGNSICTSASGSLAGQPIRFPVEGYFEGSRGTMSSKISAINSIQVDLRPIIETIKKAQ